MPIPQGVSAINTLLQYSDEQSPATFVTVANVGDLGWDMLVEHVDVTSHSSGTPDRQMFPTLRKNGPLTFPLFWVPNDPAHQVLLGMWQSRTQFDWRIVWPSGAGAKIVSFFGALGDWKASAKVADVIHAAVTIVISGKMYF